MHEPQILDNVTPAAGQLLKAAAEFLRHAMPQVPDSLARELAACSEIVVSARVHPSASLCVSGKGPRGLVKWDIALGVNKNDLN